MKDQHENPIDPEDELRAENELIKLKLELEHGMKGMETSSLNPAMENQWLSNIYNFEQRFKNAKRIRLYDFIGKPAYSKVEELTPKEISTELKRIISVMDKRGIALDVLAHYEDAVIYKFITEELFDHEMDDMAIEGMIHHFCYEEFHPNHDYDLRRYAREFIESLLEKKWNEEFDSMTLVKQITFNGQEYDVSGVSAIIKMFQEEHHSFHIDHFEINQVNFDLETNQATVQAQLRYSAQASDGSRLHEGKCKLDFIREWDYWCINQFVLPGFG